ncbi:MAG: EF-hand domain-containing protein [Candidatus Sericytochromatia bacterium]|nr:EF-hand domain-containing protein [Candidatus Sericytochromatia bacterium]
MRRLLVGALALSMLAGCGVLPGLPGTAEDETAIQTQEYYRVMNAEAGASASGSAAVDPRSDRMKALFAKADANGDGQVSYEEFVAALPPGGRGMPRPGDVFDRIDDDGNGGIGDDEFRGGHERRGRPGPGGKKRGGKKGGKHGRGHGQPGMGRPPFPPPFGHPGRPPFPPPGMPPASGDLPPAPPASGDVPPLPPAPPASGDVPPPPASGDAPVEALQG